MLIQVSEAVRQLSNSRDQLQARPSTACHQQTRTAHLLLLLRSLAILTVMRVLTHHIRVLAGLEGLLLTRIAVFLSRDQAIVMGMTPYALEPLQISDAVILRMD